MKFWELCTRIEKNSAMEQKDTIALVTKQYIFQTSASNVWRQGQNAK